MINSADFFRLVSDFGQSLTVTKVTTDGTYDTTTGTVSGSASTNYSCTGYFYTDTEGSQGPTKTIAGSRSLVFSALNLGFVPEDGDRVVGFGEIRSVRTVDQKGTPVVYLCEVLE